MHHESVGIPLDGLAAALHGVLVLLVGFTLPGWDEASAQEVLDAVTEQDVLSSGDKFGGNAAIHGIVLKGFNEAVLALEGVDASDLGEQASKNGSNCGAAVAAGAVEKRKSAPAPSLWR